MKRTFSRAGAQLPVQGRGQEEGRQLITTLRRKGMRRCFKDGCERYEKGYTIALNLSDKADANLLRYIREGKAGRYAELPMPLEDGGVSPVLVQIQFPPGECPGHRLDWQDDPIYIVGERKTVHDEWQDRYRTGAEALVVATTRLKDMQEG